MIEDETSKPDENSETEAQAEEPTFAPSETATEPVLDTTSEDTETKPVDGDADALAEESANLEARVLELESEAANLNDKLLRALAETENVRRRAQRDREDAAKYAINSFAEDMLRVSDNLSRALSSINADARAVDGNLENIAVGVEMVMKELLTAFERSGVKQIEAMGARFDPMLHEALFEIQDPDQPAGTIAQVMEDGFTLHGRTLRASKVGITKGGPKVAAPKEAEAENKTQSEVPAQRDGQQAYESQSELPPEAGGQVDQEL